MPDDQKSRPEPAPGDLGFPDAHIGLDQIGNPRSYPFIRGDINDDTSVNLPDAIFSLSALFVPGSSPATCLDAADMNDDGSFNLPDAIYLLSALFVPGSPSVPDPVGSCGTDPTDDTIDCELNNCP